MKSKKKLIKFLFIFTLSIAYIIPINNLSLIESSEISYVVENNKGYLFDENYLTVSNIKENTSINNFKSSIDSKYSIKVFNGNAEVNTGNIEIGMIIEVSYADSIYNFTVVGNPLTSAKTNVKYLRSSYAEGTTLVAGNSWLQGQGVDVKGNGGNINTYWQCVEIAQKRLYPKMGWPTVYAAGNGGAQYIPEGSPGLIRYNKGSKYIPVPGDLIIESNTGHGHVAIVDYTDLKTGIIYAVEQNAPDYLKGRTTYRYNGSNYIGGTGGNNIKCIMHAPNNKFKNPGDPTLPDPVKVTKIEVTNETSTGYTVTVSLDNPSAATNVDFISWAKRYGNAKKSIKVAVNNQNKVSYNVKTSDYNGETGIYYTDIVVYQKDRDPLQGVKLPNDGRITGIIPELKNISYSNVDSTGFTINADVVKLGKIDEVKLYIWTPANGQDDLEQPIVKIENNKLSYRVKRENHNGEFGEYSTHLEAKDIYGDKTKLIISQSNPQIPALTNVKVSNIDSSGYTVSGTMTDTKLLQSKIEVVSWTVANGQDDLKTKNAAINGNEFSYRVQSSDHNYDLGEYRTHIYAYNTNGSRITYIVPETPYVTTPKFENIEIVNVDSTGYTIKAKIDRTEKNSTVKTMIWTENNGQDDLKIYEIPIENGYINYRISRADHKGEYGIYRTHLFLKGNNPNRETKESLENVIISPFSNISITEIDSSGYTISGTINDLSSIQNKIEIVSWTSANGQDDIKIKNASITGNRFTYRIQSSDHNYELGDYRNHIYAYNLDGTRIDYTEPTTPNLKTPIITSYEYINVDSTGYTIKAKIDNYEVGTTVRAYVWTENKGQDDLKIYTVPITNGSINFRVSKSNHNNESGVYRTHLYVKGKNPKHEKVTSLSNVIVL